MEKVHNIRDLIEKKKLLENELKSNEIEFYQPYSNVFKDLSIQQYFFLWAIKVQDEYKLDAIFRENELDIIGSLEITYFFFKILSFKGAVGLVLLIKDEFISLDTEKIQNERYIEFTQLMNGVLSAHNINYNINPSTIDAIIEVDTVFKAAQLKIQIADFYYYEYKAQVEKYIEYINMFKKNPLILKDVDTGSYNHIEAFAKLYYYIIEVIKNKIPDKQPFSIHDVGTCKGFLPMVLNYEALNKQMNINEILISDISSIVWTHIQYISRYYKEKNKKQFIQFLLLDMTLDSIYIPKMDVVTIIDVFEHFNDEEKALSALQRLWGRTKRLLIMHVPFEEVPNPNWGHHIKFSPSKLINWASTLEGGHFISNELLSIKGECLIDEGFMIVERKN